MLRRVGAGLLLIGLVLPYGCDTRPLTGVWDGLASALVLGVPVVAILVYGLTALVPAAARGHERYGGALHGVLRAVFFALAGAYLAYALGGTEPRPWPNLWQVAIALAVSGTLLYHTQGRGSKGQRLPVLLMVIAALPVVAYFAAFADTGFADTGPGLWVLTAGFLVAVISEVRALAGAARITHGG